MQSTLAVIKCYINKDWFIDWPFSCARMSLIIIDHNHSKRSHQLDIRNFNEGFRLINISFLSLLLYCHVTQSKKVQWRDHRDFFFRTASIFKNATAKVLGCSRVCDVHGDSVEVVEISATKSYRLWQGQLKEFENDKWLLSEPSGTFCVSCGTVLCQEVHDLF